MDIVTLWFDSGQLTLARISIVSLSRLSVAVAASDAPSPVRGGAATSMVTRCVHVEPPEGSWRWRRPSRTGSSEKASVSSA